MEGAQVCRLRLSSVKHITRPVKTSVSVTCTYCENVFCRHAKKRRKVLRETNKQSNKEKGNKQTNTTKQLKKDSLGQPTFMKSLNKYPLVSVLLSGSGILFQCTQQLKYTMVLSSHTSIIAAQYGMA